MQSRISPESGENSWLQIWKEDFHQYEIKTLPGKIVGWGGAIDHQLFPVNSPAQIQSLVTSMNILSIRIEKLLEASRSARKHGLISKANTELLPWLTNIGSAFNRLSERPETATDENSSLQTHLSDSLVALEGHIDKVLKPVDASCSSGDDGESYYQLLDGLRGVSEACLGYAGEAGEIDWVAWREEKFS